jgi:hypothetical protein
MFDSLLVALDTLLGLPGGSKFLASAGIGFWTTTLPKVHAKGALLEAWYLDFTTCAHPENGSRASGFAGLLCMCVSVCKGFQKYPNAYLSFGSKLTHTHMFVSEKCSRNMVS